MALWCRLLLALGLSALTLGVAARDDQVRVEVDSEGDMFHVLARAEIAAEPRVAWETITDYERLPQFIPGVLRTRVLRRGPNELTVDYDGEFRFWFLREPMFMRLAVRHEPFATVLARSEPAADALPQATVRRFVARYDLTVLKLPPLRGGGTGVRLVYGARFETVRGLPPLIGAWVVRGMMREQFEAMVREIERRQEALPRGINAAPAGRAPRSARGVRALSLWRDRKRAAFASRRRPRPALDRRARRHRARRMCQPARGRSVCQ